MFALCRVCCVKVVSHSGSRWKVGKVLLTTPPGRERKCRSGWRGGLVPTVRLLPRVEFVKLASEADVVNLGQGFPDFPPPDFALEAFQHAVSGDFMLNQYTKAFVSL